MNGDLFKPSDKTMRLTQNLSVDLVASIIPELQPVNVAVDGGDTMQRLRVITQSKNLIFILARKEVEGTRQSQRVHAFPFRHTAATRW